MSASEGHLEQMALAQRLATEAGKLLLGWFGQVTADIKGDGTLVTQADLEVDRFVHQVVHEQYPHHAVLSEEIQQTYEGTEYTWVVDPLDGTTNFANGLWHWGSSIALLRRGELVLGVLDFPLLGQRFSALRGAGATRNGVPLRSVAPDGLQENQLLILDSYGVRHLNLQLPCKVRVLGSATYDLAAICAGMAVGSVQMTPKVWDLAAAWLVTEEAGAAVGPLLDAPSPFPLTPGMDYGDRNFPVLSASNWVLWEQIRKGIVFLEPRTH